MHCPICDSADHEDVLSLPAMPVLINAQVPPVDARNVVTGDIDLVVCRSCGHLFNRSFDASLFDYDAAYENTLHFSERFQVFASDLCRRLVDEHQLDGAVVAELGSGPGHFLSMLCAAGVARAVGFDPSYDPERFGTPVHDAVTISTDPFPDDGSLPADLALSQHVLEHLLDPVAALAAQRSAVLDNDGVVYTEVPNGRLMLDHCAMWDLVYEHVSYFVPTSLDLACRRGGLDRSASGAAFDGQFLWCDAIPGEPTDRLPDALEMATALASARTFAALAAARIDESRRSVEKWAERGPVVLWGSGSKGMTFLNLVDESGVAAVVDINPRKAGWGVPGTGHTISMPEIVEDLQPSTVVVANPVYLAEVGIDLAHRGVDATVVALWD